MDSMKHQTYSNGELYVELMKIHVRIQVLEAKQERSYAGNIVLAMFALSFALLSLSFVIVQEFRLVYILASFLFVSIAIFAGRNSKKNFQATIAELPIWSRNLLDDDEVEMTDKR